MDSTDQCVEVGSTAGSTNESAARVDNEECSKCTELKRQCDKYQQECVKLQKLCDKYQQENAKLEFLMTIF